MRSNHWRRLAGWSLLAWLVLLAGCGGGSETHPQQEPAANAAAAELRSRTAAALAHRGALSSARMSALSDDAAVEELLDFAQAQFPDLFPSHAATQSSPPFRFRHYPQTGVYLGVVVTAGMGYEMHGVYAMGGAFGSSPAYIGTLDALLDYDRDGVANAADAAPLDALCSAASDAAAGECFLRSLAGTRVRLVGNDAGKLFFSAEGDGLMLYGYDLKTGHFIGRGAMSGFTPSAYAYSASHGRLYVGDTAGKVHAYTESLTRLPAPLASIGSRISAMGSAGKYLLVQGSTGALIFDRNGIETGRSNWLYYASDRFEWSAAHSRVYHLTTGVSPADIVYDVIDQATGTVTASGDSPYHGDYLIMPPLRVNPAGSRLLLGSGDVYVAPGLSWAGKITVASVIDATWLSNDEVLVATSGSTGVRLQRFGADRTPLEQLDLGDVQLLGFASHEGAHAIVLQHASHVEIRAYTASNDSDGDGVLNVADKFPLDPAAAVDSDGDGHPDAWLSGRSQADSTTGLTLDAYPRDGACHAADQGNGTSCDPIYHTPSGTPDRILTDGQGTVYLFHRDAGRIYRWSGATNNFFAPLIVGQPDGAGVMQAPRSIAWSAEHRRLYLGYDSGRITYLDVPGNGGEHIFGAVSMSVRGLGAAGKYLVVQDDSGAWATHYVFDKAGVLTDSKDWNYHSTHYEWAPMQGRLYFYRSDSSPGDLLYEEIGQADGRINGEGESPYHGDYPTYGPIRVSAGGGRIALGSGNIFSTTDLTVVKSFGTSWVDMQWLADGRLATLVSNGANARVTVHTSAFAVQREHLIDGVPHGLVVLGNNSLGVVTGIGDVVRVTRLTP